MKRLFRLKKFLSFVLLTFLTVVVTVGFLVWRRYNRNPEQIIPLPYRFTTPANPISLEAPILIIGDRMGSYMAKFESTLAKTISMNLEKPIKIQSLAMEGQGLHRNLHQLKKLDQWPQILIYHGGSEEFSERKFELNEKNKIRNNFKLYQDDRIETFLILYPWLSRIVYEPVKRINLGPIANLEKLSEKDYLDNLETELLLFEQHLTQLVSMSKDRNTLLILTTTPINLSEPPRKVCEFTTTRDIEAEIVKLKELMESGNPKEAYARSSKLVLKYSGNAELFFLHGQISKRLGKLDEAINTLLSASAYDCSPWRSTEVNNSIIRKVAKEQQAILFDFAKLVEKDFGQNTTFFDEIHPQNLYYDKGMEQLGLAIKNILKL